MDSLVLKAFVKHADIIFGNNKHPVTHGGIFVGTDKDHEAKTMLLNSLLQEHGSVQKTRAAYQKVHPEDFVTTAFRRTAPPKQGLFDRIRGKKFEPLKDTGPRAFIQVGRTASPDQHEFYDDVSGRTSGFGPKQQTPSITYGPHKQASAWDPVSPEAEALPQDEFEALYNKMPQQILKREERKRDKAQATGLVGWLQRQLP